MDEIEITESTAVKKCGVADLLMLKEQMKRIDDRCTDLAK